MSNGSPYVMSPGSRLYIGPHGIPKESLGACCSPCNAGGPCSSGLGGIGETAGVASVLVVGGLVAVGAAVLFPKVWGNFMDSLWGK